MTVDGDPGRFAYYELGDTKLVRGEGVRVWDADGRELLDCVSGTFNLILGHNHPEVVATIKEQSDELIFASSMFQTEATNTVMAQLVALSPPNLTRVNLRTRRSRDRAGRVDHQRMRRDQARAAARRPVRGW